MYDRWCTMEILRWDDKRNKSRRFNRNGQLVRLTMPSQLVTRCNQQSNSPLIMSQPNSIKSHQILSNSIKLNRVESFFNRQVDCYFQSLLNKQSAVDRSTNRHDNQIKRFVKFDKSIGQITKVGQALVNHLIAGFVNVISLLDRQ